MRTSNECIIFKVIKKPLIDEIAKEIKDSDQEIEEILELKNQYYFILIQ